MFDLVLRTTKSTNMKTPGILKLILSIIIATCLSGCYSLYYAPTAHNVPMFKEKNEVRISAAYSIVSDVIGDNPIEGFEFQSAYAAGKHFAIMVNGFKAQSTEDDESYSLGYRHQKANLAEFGAGYFKPFHKNKLVFEAYGGLGVGQFKNRYIDEYDSANTIFSSLNFKRFFVQPSIGYSSDYFALAFSMRLALLKYDQKPQIDLGTSYFLVEPCFTIRAGWKSLKFQSQLQLSNNVTDPGFPQHRLNFNTGICLILPVKKSIE